MIELIVLNYLKENLDVPVSLEKLPKEAGSYVVFEKTSSGKTNHLPTSIIAFQSYGESLYKAVMLNESVKEVVEDLIKLDEIRGITLNSDYNFTDTTTKEYRYQAVYEIKYY